MSSTTNWENQQKLHDLKILLGYRQKIAKHEIIANQEKFKKDYSELKIQQSGKI